MKDLRVVIPHRAGATLQMLEALSEAGVNLAGFCGDVRPGETWGYLHVLVPDGDAAREVIESVGLEITHEHEVDVVEVEDRPGALAETMRHYTDVGHNIEVLYIDGHGRIVVGTEAMQGDRVGVNVEDARY
jgi:hypothetical protein